MYRDSLETSKTLSQCSGDCWGEKAEVPTDPACTEIGRVAYNTPLKGFTPQPYSPMGLMPTGP